MIKRIFCLTISFFVAILLDTVLLPRLVPYAIRPSAMMALVLAMSVSLSLWSAGAVAALGGLAEDMLCSEAVGLSSATLLIAAAVLSSLLHKNTFKKGILYLVMTGIILLMEGISAFFFRLFGAKFDILYTLFFNGLFRSLGTSLCALLLISFIEKLKKGRIAQS